MSVGEESCVGWEGEVWDGMGWRDIKTEHQIRGPLTTKVQRNNSLTLNCK